MPLFKLRFVFLNFVANFFFWKITCCCCCWLLSTAPTRWHHHGQPQQNGQKIHGSIFRFSQKVLQLKKFRIFRGLNSCYTIFQLSQLKCLFTEHCISENSLVCLWGFPMLQSSIKLIFLTLKKFEFRFLKPQTSKFDLPSIKSVSDHFKIL